MPKDLQSELKKIGKELEEIAREIRRISNLYKRDREREIERKKALKARAEWEKKHLRSTKRQ